LEKTNYRDALRFVDYLVIDEDNLSNKIISEISNILKVPKLELQNILSEGAKKKGAYGI
jgi:hypothetical protein